MNLSEAPGERQWLLNVEKLRLLTPQQRVLLEDLNLKIGAGEVVLIQGGNGSGKTTLIRCLLGIWPHYQGVIERGLEQSQVEYLPQIQSPEVHLPLTIRDLLLISTRQERDEEILSVGLLEAEQLDYNWNSASGGEKKRTLLTRTLLNHPQLIFLDEPFNHLDRASHDLMVNRLRQFVATDGGALVLVSHHDQGIEFFADLPLQKVVL